MIVWLQQIEAGEVSPVHVDWRTRAGVLWRMLHYATRCTDASVDAFLEAFAKAQAAGAVDPHADSTGTLPTRE
jgi:hypothetical protein